MTVVDLRDVRVSVTFAEEEARFLGGLVEASVPHLTDLQAELAHRICCKMILQASAAIQDLIDLHGEDAVSDATQRSMDAYPHVDDVALP